MTSDEIKNRISLLVHKGPPPESTFISDGIIYSKMWELRNKLLVDKMFKGGKITMASYKQTEEYGEDLLVDGGFTEPIYHKRGDNFYYPSNVPRENFVYSWGGIDYMTHPRGHIMIDSLTSHDGKIRISHYMSGNHSYISYGRYSNQDPYFFVDKSNLFIHSPFRLFKLKLIYLTFIRYSAVPYPIDQDLITMLVDEAYKELVIQFHNSKRDLTNDSTANPN